MKLFLTISLLLAVFATAYGEVLHCYNCNSQDDPNCLDKPTETMNCGHFIADLSSDRFRCITVKAGSGADKFTLRRCAVNNDCRYQVENKKFGWSDRQYTDATCDECSTRLCNKD